MLTSVKKLFVTRRRTSGAHDAMLLGAPGTEEELSGAYCPTSHITHALACG
jgi:hypothetical protein